MSKTNQFRNWCFTVNNYTEDDITLVNALPSKYVVYGYETAETGTPHLQGYAEFPAKHSLRAMKKMLPRAHFEPRKGTSVQAATYCKKTGNFHEHGTISAQGARNDIKHVVDAISEGKSFEDILDTSTSYQALQIAKVAFPYKEPKRDWVPDVYWFWGPPGCGKTHAAFHMFPDLRVHKQAGSTKWWQGYDAHPVVIIDDLRRHHIDFVRLLELLDRYPTTVENKGGSRQFVARHIFITSPEPPDFMWHDFHENIEQLLRRITQIREFDTKYVGPVQTDDAVHNSSAPVSQDVEA